MENSRLISHPEHEIINTLPSMVLVVDANLKVQLANYKFCSELNTKEEDIVGQNILDAMESHPFRHQFVQAIRKVNLTKQEVKFEHPAVSDKDKTWGWTIVPQTDQTDQRLQGLVFIGADITNKITEIEKLRQQAVIDPLTGFYNRSIFDVEEDTENRHRQPKEDESIIPKGIFVIDIDCLRDINNDKKFGHLIGDKIIKLTSEVIKKSFRAEDIFIRYGGDEFVVIGDLTGDKAEIVIDRVSKNVKLSNVENTTLPKLGLSVGFSSIDPNKEEPFTQAFKSAEEEMYQMKEIHHSQNDSKP